MEEKPKPKTRKELEEEVADLRGRVDGIISTVTWFSNFIGADINREIEREREESLKRRLRMKEWLKKLKELEKLIGIPQIKIV
jgi:hypothetical protein